MCSACSGRPALGFRAELLRDLHSPTAQFSCADAARSTQPHCPVGYGLLQSNAVVMTSVTRMARVQTPPTTNTVVESDGIWTRCRGQLSHDEFLFSPTTCVQIDTDHWSLSCGQPRHHADVTEADVPLLLDFCSWLVEWLQLLCARSLPAVVCCEKADAYDFWLQCLCLYLNAASVLAAICCE